MRFLYIYEHSDREFYIASQVKAYLTDCGYYCDISSLAFDFSYKVLSSRPDCVILPFLPKSDTPLGKFILKSNLNFLVMNWEQYLSESSSNYRSNILKDYSRFDNVSFLSWTKSFTSFLVSNDIPLSRVYKTKDYNLMFIERYNHTRTSLRKNVLGDYNTLVFCPMNYAWAFVGDNYVSSRVANGYNEKIAYEYIEYSKKCLYKFVVSIQNFAISNPRTLVIIRPHPSVSVNSYTQLFSNMPENIIVSKDGEPRDLLIASDCLVTSWSTMALHKHLSGGRSVLFTPYNRPSFLNVSWNDFLPNVKDITHQALFEHHESLDNISSTEFYDMKLFDSLSAYIAKIKVSKYKYFNRYVLRLLVYNLKNSFVFYCSKKGLIKKNGIFIDHPSSNYE